MAGAGQSIQTMYLQMELAKAYGIAEYKKLNPLFVNLSHPDGLVAPAFGPADHGLVPRAAVSVPRPREGHAQGVELLRRDGGPGIVPFGLVHEQVPHREPQAFKAVVDAFKEATDLINTNRRKAAEIYVADTGGKESVEETEKQLADPEFIFDLGPKKLIKLTDFMNASGTIKGKPTSWKEMFFPEVHDLAGD